jgi:protein involved in polysaccharide export with SLBB domain
MKKYIIAALICFCVTLAQAQNEDKTNNANTIPNLTNTGISVTIGGYFPITGSYQAYIGERVDAFVTRMFNQARDAMLKNAIEMYNTTQVIKQLNEYSFRGIILKKKNGDTVKVDLLKFRVTGDFKYNPYLENDDIIIFPSSDYQRNFFTVGGAVNSPGTFPFADGDKLSDALILAQGIDKAYENIIGIQVDRLSNNGELMKSINLNLTDNIPLERGDRITVLAGGDQKIEYSVNVIGEVRMPGKVPITKDGTTIKEVIDKCGGFNSDADLDNSELVRDPNVFKSLTFSEQVEKLRMARMSTLVEDDTLYFNIDEALRLLRANGLVDFNKVEQGDTSESNFIMRDGDVVYIPPEINLVYVFGQVNNSGYVKYVPGKDYKYYIEQAGNLGQTASGEIYLIKGKSRAWYLLKDLKEGEQKIEPGDYLWASKTTPRTVWWTLDQVTRIATIVTGLATLVLLYYQIK